MSMTGLEAEELTLVSNGAQTAQNSQRKDTKGGAIATREKEEHIIDHEGRLKVKEPAEGNTGLGTTKMSGAVETLRHETSRARVSSQNLNPTEQSMPG